MSKGNNCNVIDDTYSHDAICYVQLTNDDILYGNSEIYMSQIAFDYSIIFASVTVVFTRLIVSEDKYVIVVLTLIGHIQLV